MKSKILKIIFSTTALGLATSSVAAISVSCGHKNPSSNKKYSWDQFKTAAEKESAINIVNNATIKAIGWSYLKDDDVSITSGPTVDGHNIEVVITSKSQRQYATFIAIYQDNTKYVNSVWNCTVQPKDFTAWNIYKLDAQEAVSTSAGILEILISIQNDNPNNEIIPTAWVNAFKNSDFMKSLTATNPQIQDTKHKISFTIKSSNLNGQATIMATENGNDRYETSDYWVAKSNGWDEFNKSALAETAIRIVDNSSPVISIWKDLKANDLTIRSNSSISPDVSVVIDYKAKNEWATFNIKYVTNVKYNVKNWVCTVLPIPPSNWETYKDAATKQVSSSSGILAVLESVQKDNHLNKIIPATWVAKFQDSTFASSLTAAKPTINDDKHTLQFIITSSNVSGQVPLTAREKGTNPFTITDFDVQQSNFEQWFYKGIENITSWGTESKYISGFAILNDHSILPRFHNLTKILNAYNENDSSIFHIYAIISDLKPINEGNQEISFNMTLWYGINVGEVNPKNDKKITSSFPMHVKYQYKWGSTFDLNTFTTFFEIEKDATSANPYHPSLLLKIDK